MTRPAVGVATSVESALSARDKAGPKLPQPLANLSRQLGYGRRFRPRRTQLAVLVAVVVGIWLVYVFGSSLSQLNQAKDRESAAGGETTALANQLEAAERELALVQTNAFQALQARSYGLGAPGEIVFSLEQGAPSAPPIIPLGGTTTSSEAQTPLESWLRLLFGD